MTLKVKTLIAVAAASAFLAAGWNARGWLEDSKDLAALNAQQALADELRDDLGAVAQGVEDQISRIKPTETIIDRGIVREIQKPVFRNVCIPPDSESFRMLNRIAAGKDSGEPAGESARDTAEAD